MRIDLPYTGFTLANGLRVLVHEEHALPLVAVNLWYHVGSMNEQPGRTGFAHLFEHLMFEGSANVPKGQFDALLEEAGGSNNGSTSQDRTNYWETVPPAALDLALFLEADRMGGLLPAMTQDKLDGQRDVVKNERRQSYENRPYGLAHERILELLYPPGHPYRWPTIGSMADLDAASLDDVATFFRTYYAPNNASLVVAGAVSAAAVQARVEKLFGAIPPGPAVPPVTVPPARLDAPVHDVMSDDVQLPRLYLAWHTPPYFAPGDAELDLAGDVLAQGKNARLYRTLIYERQVAQDVTAFQGSAKLGSVFYVVVTARPGQALEELERTVRAELAALAEAGPDTRELDRALHQTETEFVDALQSVGDFDGRADRLNEYLFYVGDPGYAARDMERYRQVTPAALCDAVRTYVAGAPAVSLHVVPRADATVAGGAR